MLKHNGVRDIARTLTAFTNRPMLAPMSSADAPTSETAKRRLPRALRPLGRPRIDGSFIGSAGTWRAPIAKAVTSSRRSPATCGRRLPKSASVRRDLEGLIQLNVTDRQSLMETRDARIQILSRH